MAKLTHKTRAMRKLEALGWTVGDVEKRIPHTKITQDLFEFADLLAFDDERTLLIQVTSANGGNVSARVTRCIQEEKIRDRVARWLRSGRQFEVWGVRDIETRDGSFAASRSFKLTHGGRRVTAYEGSEVLT